MQVITKIKAKSFKLENFGCQMNVADAIEVKKSLCDNGFVEETKDIPDFIIINSCAIRETAENRIYSRLNYYSQFKKEKDLKIVLMGCLAQKDKKDVLKRVPQIDLVVGTHQKYHLAKILKNKSNKEDLNYTSNNLKYKTTNLVYTKKTIKSQFKVYDKLLGYRFNEALKSEKYPFKADINIIHGCNKMCSYCIVPFTRGKEISRFSGDIINNVKILADKGVSEILLLGQNVNSYGQDSKDINFSNLLFKLNKISGIKRIRFLTSHPMDFNMDLIDVISESKNICKYVHLPLQSASDKVLKDMKRDYSYQHYLHIINEMKKKIKGLSLSTDIIVGFPYESEEDFEQTFNAIKEVRYDTAFMFKYSIRKGTPAASHPDHIDENEKKRRLNIIINKQAEIRQEINESYIGNIEEVLLEGKSKSNEAQMIGKTDGNKAVVINAAISDIGKYVKVKLKSIKGNTFYGEKIAI